MSKKLYYAYVVENLVDYFERKLEVLKDKIKIVSKKPAFSEKGEPLVYYIIEAEEGVIDPKWELK